MEPLRIERRDCWFDIFSDDAALIIRGRVKNADTAKNIIADAYHYLWYVENIGNRRNIVWFGRRLIKNPLDLWIYQELIYKVKPDIIIETGTYEGGSAYYLACLLDILKKGKIITIDIEQSPVDLPVHDRIMYLVGSSTSSKIINLVEKEIAGTVLVILDSDHNPSYVLKELNVYSQYVTKGSYIIVEDTNMGGNPIKGGKDGGPVVAVKKFLRHNRNFVIDADWERFRITSCPNGFLKRIE